MVQLIVPRPGVVPPDASPQHAKPKLSSGKAVGSGLERSCQSADTLAEPLTLIAKSYRSMLSARTSGLNRLKTAPEHNSIFKICTSLLLLGNRFSLLSEFEAYLRVVTRSRL